MCALQLYRPADTYCFFCIIFLSEKYDSLKHVVYRT